MAQWLFGLIKRGDDDRAPDFARQSHVNWARALSFEVSQEHGATVSAQRDAVRKHFDSCVTRRKIGDDHLVKVFEPLFGSLQFSTSLVSLVLRGATEPWECPSATVTWYYAVYNAFRAMFAACNDLPGDTHTAAIRALNGELRALLPHPFDMVAERVSGESYADRLPRYPLAKRKSGPSAAINGAFVEDRTVACRMLLEYLHGSADYWTWHTREQILAKGSFKNFRSNAAKQERDRRLKPAVNFLDCAFRYRGKANYRDAIFLSNGQTHARVGLPFVSDLASTSRFVTLMAAGYVRARVGSKLMDAFATDMQAHFAGHRAFGTDLPA